MGVGVVDHTFKISIASVLRVRGHVIRLPGSFLSRCSAPLAVGPRARNKIAVGGLRPAVFFVDWMGKLYFFPSCPCSAGNGMHYLRLCADTATIAFLDPDFPLLIRPGTWCLFDLTILLRPSYPHTLSSTYITAFAMVFGKGFRSKMEKMFSSQDREVTEDPPPPYALPEEFAQVGIKEDDLAILKDYDTVIVVDDSGSMDPLWSQVRCLLFLLSTELIVEPRCLPLQACKALATLAAVASRYDKNGIDIHFLNHDKAGQHLKVGRFLVRLYRHCVNDG